MCTNVIWVLIIATFGYKFWHWTDVSVVRTNDENKYISTLMKFSQYYDINSEFSIQCQSINTTLIPVETSSKPQF